MSPWFLLVVLALAVAILFFVFRRYRRKHGRLPGMIVARNTAMVAVLGVGAAILWQAIVGDSSVWYEQVQMEKPVGEPQPPPPPPWGDRPVYAKPGDQPDRDEPVLPYRPHDSVWTGYGDGDSATGPDTAAWSLDLVDRIFGSLDTASIGFNAPDRMTFAETKQIELLLSPALSTEQLRSLLHDQGGADTAEVRISNRMEATLSGPGFTILSLTPDLQAVSRLQVTRWAWDVTAAEAGEHTLHLTLSAHIEVAGSDVPIVIRTFDRGIAVRVTLSQRVSGFVSSNWQWLWATVVVPVAGLLWRSLRKKGKSAKTVGG